MSKGEFCGWRCVSNEYLILHSLQNLLLCTRYYVKAEWIDTKTYGNFNILFLRYSYRFSRWHAMMGIAKNFTYPILWWLNNSEKWKDKYCSMTMAMVRQCYARSALIGDARIYQKQRELCNIACPPETHLKIISREISFAHNIRLSRSVILKFRTEHGGITVKNHNEWTTAKYVMGQRDLMRFEFEMRFRRIPHIAQDPRAVDRNEYVVNIITVNIV